MHGEDGLLQVKGDGSSLVWRRPRQASTDYGICLEETDIAVDLSLSGTVRGFQALCAAMRGTDRSPYAVRDARLNLEILFGIVESCRQGGRRVGWPIPRRGDRLVEHQVGGAAR